MRKTKKNYEIMLNEMYRSACETSFTIKGKEYQGEYGTLLRKHNPTAFLIGYWLWIKYE